MRIHVAALAIFAASLPDQAAAWTSYGGDKGGSRYVADDQITPENVDRLEVAWTFRTGDLDNRPEAIRDSAFEGTPILIGNKLVFCTPFNEVIALDPATGDPMWRFDPDIPTTGVRPGNQYVCRGVAHWADLEADEDAACRERIYMGTNDARLVAIDLETGKLCPGFGENGTVRIDPGMALEWPGEFQITSPPAIVGNVVVVGSAIGDNRRRAAPRGTVRAYNIRTGALVWTFDPIPRERDDPASGSWESGPNLEVGHANVWSVMSVDEARGLIFLPTSSPSPDFFGGLRAGENRYADSVVALRGATGEVVWHFQTVHHDIWDYDLPAQPGLYDLTIDGETVPAVVQGTKTGFLFVLHRETGEPIFEVEERPFPRGTLPEEWVSPTQPVPSRPPPLVPQRLSPEDAWGLTFFDRRACRDKLEKLRTGGLFTPPSLEGTVLFPFNGGGVNWGSLAFDPVRQLAFVNTSRMAHIVRLFESERFEAVRAANPPAVQVGPQKGTRYGVTRELLLSPFGLPCNPPPWGVLTALDLSDGTIKWESTLGTTRDLAPLGIALDFGTPNFGGPMATSSGLVFIAATMDYYLRAFSAETGKELWKGRLPAGGQATPMSYSAGGRQYVVIAAGGHSTAGTKLGDSLIAFALPR